MRTRVLKLLRQAVDKAFPAQGDTTLSVEPTKREEHGDFSSNIALALAGRLGRRPREIAETIAAGVACDGIIESVNIAGPGFINMRVARAAWQQALGDVVAAGSQWGRGQAVLNAKILLEHPSPNPTGPLHVAHGRIAAVGDALARLLRFAGYATTTECYVNDHGSKIRLFAESIAARGDGKDPPPAGYRGAYVQEIAEQARRAGIAFHDHAQLGAFGVAQMLEDIETVLRRFRATPEAFVHECDLYERGEVQATLDHLRAGGWLEEREEAIWFRSTDLAEDDKDRVVVRRTGEPTYFAADVAYHRHKFARGYSRVINILGADHHGHLARMRAAVRALGQDERSFEVLLVQIVTLLRGGQKVAMDKSAGQFVTLREVLDEVGVDAARFFFLMRRHDSPLDFDLELAKKRALDNPVYYVQYAHARACAIMRRARELGFETQAFSVEIAKRLELPEEIAMVRTLVSFPTIISEAALAREPHRIVYYAQELAQAFQSYYTRLQKVHNDPILPQRRHREGNWKATWNVTKTSARLLWVCAIRQVLSTALDLVGVEAPESMERTPMAEEETDGDVQEVNHA